MIASLLSSLWPFGGGSQPACRVLFVCMGNICRSPTAEAVFRRYLRDAGLETKVACASVGTHDFNQGVLADGRAREAAQRRGYDMSRMRGRGIADEDFERFDLIVAMDRQNLEALRRRCPPGRAEHIRLLMEFAREHDAPDVPDPYFGNAQAFELVLDLIEEGCAALLEHVRERHLAPVAAPQAGAGEAGPPRD